MARNKISCAMTPEVNGEPSEMYNELLKKEGLRRPVANYIYSRYVASNMGDVMDQLVDANGNKKYYRNKQGEHSAANIADYIGLNTILQDITSLSATETKIGATDAVGNRIDYDAAKVALEKADALNNSSKGLVATVVQHGDKYNIIVAEKNSRTQGRSLEVRKKLQAWDVYKQVFNQVGVDIENMPQEIKDTISPFNPSLVTSLNNIKLTGNNLLTRHSALILFKIDEASPEVQRLIKSFGSIEDAAQAVYDIAHGSTSYTGAQQLLLQRAINHAKQFNGIDLNALNKQITQTLGQITSASEEDAIEKQLKKLNKKYNIDAAEIHRTSAEINSLSEAAADAAILLQRQIRILEKQKGTNQKGKQLETTLKQLLSELANKRYCFGVLNFLKSAANDVMQIDNMLLNIQQTGTDIQQVFSAAKTLTDIDTLKNQYYDLIEALSNEKLVIDESVSQADIDNIRNSAKALKEIFDKNNKKIKDLVKDTMVNLMIKLVGDKAPDGQPIVNVVNMLAADSTIFDHLYSVGRASNPIIAAMGKILRNAEDSRDVAMANISLRIRRATDKLYKAGFNSEFMYEDDGHIISDIDWELYKAARKGAIKSFYKQGLKGFSLKQAIEQWEENNTEDRIVNKKDGRVERVPDQQYRKQFPQLTSEQQEYYDTMMQLKGEIGSLLPAYAQHHYLPPQLRRSMLDAVAHAHNAKGVVKAIWNKFENIWKIREDDTDYHMNGIIDGDEYQIAEGAFDNTELKQIPIFFVNKVAQEELLKNFSTGLAALAGTAVNYDAMNEIAQVVEFMGDYVTKQTPRDRKKKADIVQDKQASVFKDLYKRAANANTSELVNGFINQHIYGMKLKDADKWWSKLWGKIIAYTSFKGLSTNWLGAVSNALVGEFQMLIEAGAGEFYNFKDFLWAQRKMFGTSGMAGDFMELMTNNMNHKSTLLREMFDPLDDNFSDQSRKKYYKSMFRQLVSHDCSFIGYGTGEYLLHYSNMLAVLHNKKVSLNGKVIPLYDAFEVTNKVDGNSELKLKQGVTTVDGKPITQEWLDDVRRTIRYVNQTTHGAMNSEDKGIIHQKWWGRGIMNFRQWMVEHYSRRFRARHFDASLGMDREGYWYTTLTEDTKNLWKEGQKKDAIINFMKDFYTFMFRAQAKWGSMNEMQRRNIRRVRAEMLTWISLLSLSFALGDPDEKKKDWWRRFWIYQTKRLLLDTQASLPNLKMVSSFLTIMQSPMAGVNTMNSFLYAFYGLSNGDINKEIQSGKHKGENKYWRNFKKHVIPFYKHFEQFENFGEDANIFKIFEDSPTNR